MEIGLGVMKMTILIPAYEPDLRLLNLIKNIQKICNFKIVIVDDGSGPVYRSIFEFAEEYGCKVLTHQTNQGKGRALKTGFQYIKENEKGDDVVCADSDGQHLPEDIMRIGQEVSTHKGHIVLGVRSFSGKIPLRSRFGNAVTKAVILLTTGLQLKDTQTGLRGYSGDMLNWLCHVSGERFEYEMNILLEAKDTGYTFYEVEIATIYHKSHSSHFRTISDSARVYLPILKFSASSLASGGLDFVLLMLLQFVTSNLLFSVVGARICSSIFNYSMNKAFVFTKPGNSQVMESALKYFTLVVTVMAVNYSFLYFYHILIGISLFIAKILTETTVFLFSYWAQKKFVFKE